MVLAFPPVGLWWLTLATVLPGAWLAWRLSDLLAPVPTRASARRRRWGVIAAGAGFAVGCMPGWAWLMRFVIDITGPGYPGAVVYLSLYGGAFVVVGGVAGAAFRRPALRALALAVVWCGLETLRGEVLMEGFPWFLAGHPLIEWPGAAWLASLAGAYAVSLPVAMVGAGVCGLLVARGRAQGGSGGGGNAGRGAGLVAAAGVVALLAGAAVWPGASAMPEAGASLRIAAVQTNLPQDNKMAWSMLQRERDFDRFLELTRQAAGGTGEARGKPDVIVWPETTFPGLALNPEAVEVERNAGLRFRVAASAEGGPERVIPSTVFFDRLIDEQSRLGVPMLVGALASEGLRIVAEAGGGVRIEQDRRHNSVFMLREGRVEPERFDKLALTPFGEMIPHLSSFPTLRDAVLGVGAAGMEFDLSPGSRVRAFSVADAGGRVWKLVTPICFEATVPSVVRRMLVETGADLIVSPSNDGWFGPYPGGREAHLLFARWRCAELGVPMVRSVNTGRSAFIDRWGRVQQSLGEFVDGVLVAEVAPAAGVPTLYRRAGDWLAWSMLGLTGGLLGLGAWRSRSRGDGGVPAGGVS
jgi:apolipoprotein N-acyltransferase